MSGTANYRKQAADVLPRQPVGIPLRRTFRRPFSLHITPDTKCMFTPHAYFAACTIAGVGSRPHAPSGTRQAREMTTNGASDQLQENAFNSVRKQLQQQKRKVETLKAKQSKIWRRACLIYAKEHPDPEPSCAYLVKSSPQMQWTKAEVTTMLIAWHEGAIADGSLERIRAETSIDSIRAHKCADTFIKEWKLHAWMEQANLTKGVAPCSAVFADAVCLSAAEPAHVALNPSAPRKHQSKLQWLRRWRRRWGVSIGKVLAGEKIPVAEAREKARMVRPQKKRAGQFLGAVAPQSGPQKVVRKMDSVLGAQHTK